MCYLYKETQHILAHLCQTGAIPVHSDIAMGWDYLGVVLDDNIKGNDIILMVSLDGAQLFESKESDCWMYIWIFVNLAILW
ncbi:hypothetical protein BS17DRAFT_712175 [Gyrodon lividus]|nr:hypothetical protein BS17DRAFT_712175 [Gyrodon lividus]